MSEGKILFRLPLEDLILVYFPVVGTATDVGNDFWQGDLYQCE